MMDRLLRFDEEGDPLVDPDPHDAMTRGGEVDAPHDLAAFGHGYSDADAETSIADVTDAGIPADPSDGMWHVFWGRPEEPALELPDDLPAVALPFGVDVDAGVGDAVPADDLDLVDDMTPAAGEDALDTGSV